MSSWEIATCWGSSSLFYSLISIVCLQESSKLKFLKFCLCAMELFFRLNPALYIVVNCQYVSVGIWFLTHPVFTCKMLFWELAKAESPGTLFWTLLSSCKPSSENFTTNLLSLVVFRIWEGGAVVFVVGVLSWFRGFCLAVVLTESSVSANLNWTVLLYINVSFIL